MMAQFSLPVGLEIEMENEKNKLIHQPKKIINPNNQKKKTKAY